MEHTPRWTGLTCSPATGQTVWHSRAVGPGAAACHGFPVAIFQRAALDPAPLTRTLGTLGDAAEEPGRGAGGEPAAARLLTNLPQLAWRRFERTAGSDYGLWCPVPPLPPPPPACPLTYASLSQGSGWVIDVQMRLSALFVSVFQSFWLRMISSGTTWHCGGISSVTFKMWLLPPCAAMLRAAAARHGLCSCTDCGQRFADAVPCGGQ